MVERLGPGIRTQEREPVRHAPLDLRQQTVVGRIAVVGDEPHVYRILRERRPGADRARRRVARRVKTYRELQMPRYRSDIVHFRRKRRRDLLLDSEVVLERVRYLVSGTGGVCRSRLRGTVERFLRGQVVIGDGAWHPAVKTRHVARISPRPRDADRLRLLDHRVVVIVELGKPGTNHSFLRSSIGDAEPGLPAVVTRIPEGLANCRRWEQRR